VAPDAEKHNATRAVFRYGKGYQVGGRWDCLTVLDNPATGGYYGFWTASPLPAPAWLGAGFLNLFAFSNL
jgi:hypothetical protein